MAKHYRQKPLAALKITLLCLSMLLLVARNSGAQEFTDAEINSKIEQFRNEDESKDQQAVDALAKIGDRAIPDLLEALREPEARVRAGVARALGTIGAEAKEEKALALVSPLVETLNDPNQEVRRAASEALGRIGSPAVANLVDAVQKDNAIVRAAAADALGQIGADAREGVPALIEKLRDDDWRVRSSAARSLGKIGSEAKLEAPPIVRAMIETLQDSDPEVRRAAAEALGRIGSPVVPDLIAALQDENATVRAAAAEALGQIGADAREVVPNLIARLQDGDWRVRSGAAKALGKIGSQAKLEASAVVPPLIEALKDKDPEVRRAAAEVLVKIGPEAVPELLKALQDKRAPVRAGVAWALGQMGANVKGTVPVLTASLQDKNQEVRSAAAEALGRMGSEAKDAIAPLTESLQDSDKLVRGSAAEAIRRIAGNLQDKADDLPLQELERAVLNLNKAQEILGGSKIELVNDPLLFKFTKQEIVVEINRSLKALEREKETRFFERGTAWIFQHKWILFGVIYGVSLPTLWLSILWLRPLWLLNVNDALKRYKIALPLKGGMEISARDVLLVRFFDYHPRVLDAWVTAHVKEARLRFGQLATVSDRQVYIPVPVVLEGNTVANLTGKELRPVFAQQQTRLLIWGEAGAGKTSVACQIAKWAMSENPDERPREHLQLPLLIDQELDNVSNENYLLKALLWRLQSLIGQETSISEELLVRLAGSGRLLAIVDHFSEMNETTRSRIKPGQADFLASSLIVTSRIEETFEGVAQTTIKPLRVEGNRLSSFMEAYLIQRGSRDRFSDLEFFDACSLLSLIVGQRNITILLAKLYAEQLIAYKEGTLPGGLADNIPDLMLSYLNELNRGVVTHRFDDSLIHHDAKIVAWECLKATFRPASANKSAAIASLSGKQAEARLDYLEKRLRLIQTTLGGQDKIRFSLDPLAEYLAGLHLVELYGSNTEQWRAFLKQADSMPGDPQGLQGFLLAVRDCCLAKGSAVGIPSFIVEELSKRAA